MRDSKKLALKSTASLARPGTLQALGFGEQIEVEMARHQGKMDKIVNKVII